ncbi:MAG: hypothetical protein GY821_07980 [Gammaproteobacteria bacterium]|nr:hypothetical protein [Gammaproteobacteria bacterium]
MNEKKLSSADTNSFKPKLSKMMIQLYGAENAKVIYEKCQQADPYFNKFVQEVVYDQLWALPGLTLIEKSLVTITALATVEKEEQLGIHLQGYLNLDDSPNKLDMIFNYMVEQHYIRATNLVFTIITNLIGDRDNIHPATLSDREKGIIDARRFHEH